MSIFMIKPKGHSTQLGLKTGGNFIFGLKKPLFKYRKKYTITENSGSDLLDYQVLIEETTSSVFSLAKNDGSDIRFFTEDGTCLPYWIEKWDADNNNAKIWVKVPSIPASGQVSIYAYFGNPELVSASSPELTFIRVIDGCVLALPMDEGSGDTVYDKSGNDNDGTIYGGATWTDGKFGKALNFDGEDDYVEVLDSESLKIMGDLTMIAWVYPELDVSIYQGICGKGKAGEGFMAVDTRNEDYQLAWRQGDGSNEYAHNFLNFFVLGEKWYFVVVVRDENTLKAYRDGEFFDSLTFSYTVGATSINFYVGRREDGWYFNGLIDEVRIYNRALSEEEIQNLYNYYGYNTENYPGKTLVRKKVDSEPSVDISSAIETLL